MAAETEDLSALRAQVRAWCEANVTRTLHVGHRTALTKDVVEQQKAWFHRLQEAGYAVPHWPAKWGGGRSYAEQLVINQELRRSQAPELNAFVISLNHIPGTLLAHGSDEQQRRHLGAILEGAIWCQGFSEPDAGSDLASLRTAARPEGHNFIITGQKVWATAGLHADWCLLLARTDGDAPKRKGITAFLVDMTSPGVEVRGIRQSTGSSNFAEIFLDGVVVPGANVVGEINEGWKVAQTTLATERGPILLEFADGLEGIMSDLIVLTATVESVGGVGLSDSAVLESIALLYEEVQAARLLCNKVISQTIERGSPGPESSVIKLFFSEVIQRVARLAVSINGTAEILAPSGDSDSSWFLDYLDTWEFTISGGTNEIQRSLIGERVLGLPRDPSMK